MEIDEQELSKKLAEFAGFYEGTHIADSWYERRLKWRRGDKFWVPPGMLIQIKLPNFPQSQDACEEWLVPEITKRGYNIHIHYVVGKRPKVVISNTCFTYSATNDKVSLAFCLAIEKLINKES